MRRLFVYLAKFSLFIFCVTVSISAHADDRDVAREHYLKGTKDFDLGLYEDAIKEYMAAYQAKDDPALLYNLGQAHRQAGHPIEALRFYKRYLAKIPDARNAAEVENKIDELQKLIDQQSKTQAMPPAGPAPLSTTKPAEPAPAPPVAAPAPVIVPAPVVVVEAPKPTPVYKKWWLWTVVGVVAVGVGVGLGVGLSGSKAAFNPGLGTVGPGK